LFYIKKVYDDISKNKKLIPFSCEMKTNFEITQPARFYNRLA